VVCSQAIYRGPQSLQSLEFDSEYSRSERLQLVRSTSRMESREKAGEIESGAHGVGGCRIGTISCNCV
jgi:hypothetical protein